MFGSAWTVITGEVQQAGAPGAAHGAVLLTVLCCSRCCAAVLQVRKEVDAFGHLLATRELLLLAGLGKYDMAVQVGRGAAWHPAGAGAGADADAAGCDACMPMACAPACVCLVMPVGGWRMRLYISRQYTCGVGAFVRR